MPRRSNGARRKLQGKRDADGGGLCFLHPSLPTCFDEILKMIYEKEEEEEEAVAEAITDVFLSRAATA